LVGLLDFLGFPNVGADAVDIWGANESTTLPTTVTSGTSSAKGSWVQMTASTLGPIFALLFEISRVTAPSPDYPSAFYADIGIGGAGSEVVLVADIPVQLNNAPDSFLAISTQAYIPVAIASGIRVSVRIANSSATAYSGNVMIHAFRRN